MYAPRPTAIAALFADLITPGGIGDIERAVFFREIANRLPFAYAATLEAVDPNDSENRKSLDLKLLSAIVRGGFINAQRGLDDDTFREKDVLGKVVEVLFQSALTDPVDAGKRSTAEQLKIAVEQIQGDLHTGFNANLTSLLPTFDLFGYLDLLIRGWLPRQASMLRSCSAITPKSVIRGSMAQRCQRPIMALASATLSTCCCNYLDSSVSIRLRRPQPVFIWFS